MAAQPSQSTEQANETVLKLMKVNRLPVLEPEVFHGNIREYPIWLKAFESYIEGNTDSHIERLHFLGRYTTGEARQAIVGFLQLRTENAYEMAKEKLHSRYGNEFIMVSAYRERIKC